MGRVQDAGVLQRHSVVAAGLQLVLLAAIAAPYTTEEALTAGA